MHITETWHGKPCGIKVLGTKRTRAPIPLPFAYQFLKLFKLIPSRKSFGSSFHNFAATYLSECKPYLVVLTLGMLTVVVSKRVRTFLYSLSLLATFFASVCNTSICFCACMIILIYVILIFFTLVYLFLFY